MKRSAVQAIAVTALLMGVTLGLLAACGNDDSDKAAVPSRTIEVTIEGDTVEPNGERIKVSANEEIRFVVTSDRSNALHVHSSPEQTLDFEAGTTTLTTTIDKPGIVEVETADTDTMVVQLQVE